MEDGTTVLTCLANSNSLGHGKTVQQSSVELIGL
jgi:hypothetical protein